VELQLRTGAVMPGPEIFSEDCGIDAAMDVGSKGWMQYSMYAFLCTIFDPTVAANLVYGSPQ
jgi:hypothetical protein